MTLFNADLPVISEEAPLIITLLGKLEITLNGVPLAGRRRKSLALLAYLAATGKACRRETLAGLLWGEASEVNANAGLRKALAELRTLIGPYLLEKDRQISFNRSLPYRLDADAFEQGVAGIGKRQGVSLSPEEAATLATAIDGYHGDFLTGFYVQRAPEFEEWVTLQRERLRLAAIDGLYTLSVYSYSRGDFQQSRHYTRRLLEMDPCQEEAHRQMMSLLALGGQRELALRQYQHCRQTLADTFGVAPQAETTALYQRIREGTDTGPSTEGHTLPIPPTPLLGREAEIEAIEARLTDPDCRLLTLLGPGGIGKTHLALTVGQRLIERRPPLFADGLYFVPLNPLRSIDALPTTIAHHLGYRFHKNDPPFKQLLNYLASQKLLLILDNFEHLLEKGMDSETNILTGLLGAAPGVKLMITSRVRLNLQGEHLHPLSGIEFPAAKKDRLRTKPFPAMQLFIQSVQRIAPNFTADKADLAAIAQICRQVRGLPLGILLAAGWATILSPAEIAARLTINTGEAETGLDLLESDGADLPARHRSLRRVFAYSWNLLASREQTVLANLSIFRGTFSLEAAQQIAGAGLGDLRSLVARSLVQRGSSGRYEIHELLRQFARYALEDDTEVRARHCAYYTARLEAWAADIKSEQQMAAIEALDLEIDNARAAWDWAVARGDLAAVAQAIDGVCLYYGWRYRLPEGLSACRTLIERFRQPEFSERTSQINRITAKALAWQSIFDNTNRSEPLLRQSLVCLDNPATEQADARSEWAFTLHHLARIVSQTGGLDEAGLMYAQSMALYKTLGDRWGLANALRGRGILLWDSSAYAQAQEFLEESLKIDREIGNRRGMAASLNWLGNIALFRGELEGEKLIRESRAIYAALGDHLSLIESTSQACVALMMMGQYDKARDLMQEKRMIDHRMDFRQDAIHSLLAGALIHLGAYEEARIHAKTGLKLARRLGDAYGLGFALVVNGWLAMADKQDELALSLFRENANHCETYNLKELLSWTLACWGLVEPRLGQLESAKAHLISALQTALEIKSFVATVFALAGSIPVLADFKDGDRVIEWYAAVSHYPMVANSAWFGDLVGRRVEILAEQLSPDVVAGAKERGVEQELNAVAAKVLVELRGEKS